jgi:hypothetical protein
MPRRYAFVAAVAALVTFAAPTTTLAGDAFLKLGWVFHPDRGSFSNAWLVSVGSDWGVHPQAFVGLEFQGAYYTDTFMNSVDVKTVPANVFLNFKWKSDTEGVRPFVGGGLGMVSSYVRITSAADDDAEWVKDAGIQFMGGVEFGRRWVVEVLGQKAFDDLREWNWMFLGGLRW